tara:strand:- start:16 stop:636 length:621 start_codon:yes stop_codon:yes gene_type:complete
MKILIGCEFSGTVGDTFTRLGHDVLTCDLLPTDSAITPHYQGDIMDVIEDAWEMALLFPPCTYLCSSGLHWNKRVPERAEKTEEALKFVEKLMSMDHIKYMALENPVGCISSRIRKPDQMIQPYNFGEDASKKTCLWLKNLPPLENTGYVEPRMIIGPSGKPLKRWANQTDSGQSNLGPSEDRWKIRSLTYKGIAQAMGQQWGEIA